MEAAQAASLALIGPAFTGLLAHLLQVVEVAGGLATCVAAVFAGPAFGEFFAAV